MRSVLLTTKERGWMRKGQCFLIAHSIKVRFPYKAWLYLLLQSPLITVPSAYSALATQISGVFVICSLPHSLSVVDYIIFAIIYPHPLPSEDYAPAHCHAQYSVLRVKVCTSLSRWLWVWLWSLLLRPPWSLLVDFETVKSSLSSKGMQTKHDKSTSKQKPSELC